MSTPLKRFFVVALMTVCCLGFVNEVQAQSYNAIQKDTPTRKLGRGTANVLMSWMEIPRAWHEVKRKHGDVAGITWGTFEGVRRAVVRIGIGAFEIVTFPHATGAKITPEYVEKYGDDNTFRYHSDVPLF